MKGKVGIGLLMAVGLWQGCVSPEPRPKAYPRVELPPKAYQWYRDPVCPFEFKYPAYAQITYDTLFFDTVPEDPCWLNIRVPELGATIHLTYKSLRKHTLEEVLQQTYFMAYKHTIKADYIKERRVQDSTRRLVGVFYDIGGNAASNIQFYLTNGTEHFVRGALYIKAVPNIDSLRPVIEFIRKDLDTLVATFRWVPRRLEQVRQRRPIRLLRQHRIQL